MKTVQHTPLPWFLTGDKTITPQDPATVASRSRTESNKINGGYYVCDTYGADAVANAALINTACNAHYDLLAFAIAYRESFSDHRESDLKAGEMQLLDMADAAIAKAEGA